MEAEQFPGIDEPTSRDRLAAELADEQLRLIFGLREIRIERGMSITEVAEAMGVDPAQVSRFESGGTNPTMATIRRYAKTVEALIRIDTCKWVDRAESGREGDKTIDWTMDSGPGLVKLLERMVTHSYQQSALPDGVPLTTDVWHWTKANLPSEFVEISSPQRVNPSRATVTHG